jgi:Pentapeptide repeats (8 copies)
MEAGPATAAESKPSAQLCDVQKLLASYGGAITLSRDPPASFALPAVPERIHRWLRPRWACHYFTTRYVRRRTEALERALAARIALGEADGDDRSRAEELAKFRASLTPPPSRALMIAGIVGVITLLQALVTGLFKGIDSDTGRAFFPLPTDPKRHAAIESGIDSIGLTPDVKSIRDVMGTLATANFADRALILAAIVATLYVFGRPLASGYRLSYLCLGRPDRGGRRRRTSDLWLRATELETTKREDAAVHAGRAQFRRDAPLDLIVKALPWLLVVYWFAGLRNTDGGASVPGLARWVLVGAAIVVIVPWGNRRLRGRAAPPRSRRRRVVVACCYTAASVAAFAAITGTVPTATRPTPGPALALAPLPLALAALAPVAFARLAWLARSARVRGYPAHWVALPIAMTFAVALAWPYDENAIYRAYAASGAQEYARASASIVGVPRLSRHDLQLMLATRQDLRSSDLRGQDLHRMSLRSRKLGGAQLALADLRWANLRGSDLQRADLRGALASHARMQGTDLRGADLRCSDLRGADLRGADLRGAKVGGAIRDHRTRWPRGFRARTRLATAARLDFDPDFFRGDVAVYEYVGSCLHR